MGRFITRDPIGPFGDPSALGNPYTYAANNPWSGIDPYGLYIMVPLQPGMVIDDNWNYRPMSPAEMKGWLIGARDGFPSWMEGISGGHIYFPYLHEGPDRTPGLGISRLAGGITRDVEISVATYGALVAGAGATSIAAQVGYGVPAGIGIGYELDQASDLAEGSIKAYKGGGYVSGTIQAMGVVAMVGGSVYALDEVGKFGKYADELYELKVLDEINPPKAEVPQVGVEPTKVYIDADKYPETARHIEDAIAEGKPRTLTVDRAGAAERRKAALKGRKNQPGLDNDEYPPAFTKEGGTGADVRAILSGDNRGSGASMGHQAKGVSDGEQIEIIIGPRP